MQRAKLVLPLLLLLAACTTVRIGHEFDPAAFDAKVQRGGERFEEWSYYHGSVRIPGSKDSRITVLQIKFDQRGMVRAYNWSGQRG